MVVHPLTQRLRVKAGFLCLPTILDLIAIRCRWLLLQLLHIRKTPNKKQQKHAMTARKSDPPEATNLPSAMLQSA